MLTLLEGGLTTKQVNTNKPLELLSQTNVSKDALLKKNSKLKSDSGPVNPHSPQSGTQT